MRLDSYILRLGCFANSISLHFIMVKYQSLMLVLVLFSIISCKDQEVDPSKSPYTTGYISFTYDNYVGKPVLNLPHQLKAGAPNATSSTYYPQQKLLFLQRQDSTAQFGPQLMTLSIQYFDLDKIPIPYTLTSKDPVDANFWYKQINVGNSETSGNAPGPLTLTIISKKNDRLQGEFSGTMFNSQTGIPMVIKNGKFDIKVDRQ
jgi:hypothetical protein